jgi:hypothetical protein
VKREVTTLQPGIGASLDFRLPDGVPAGRRAEIIPCLRVLSGAAVSNLQVFDVISNRTRISRNLGVLPAATTGEVMFGLAGLTGFDTARVNAVCAGRVGAGDPCDVTVMFTTTQGRILKQATFTLLPGTGGSLDFGTAEAGLPARRGEIVPCFRVGRGAALGSFEVFDTLSGLSTVSMGAAVSLAP